ncbi:MAG: hypothetical protein A2Y14_03385 [Verrucomicrobia bacterium GWF2_51_19]|nr:MAG: hypothetical protein A2Y14_03385 [Verrucomicrobia bacterium GWF2_51_19]
MCFDLQYVSYAIGQHVVLRNLNAIFAEKSIHVIRGPNGSGKTTLLRLLLGELMPTQGSIFLKKTPLHQLGWQALAIERAFLPQHHTLCFNLKVHEVIALGFAPFALLPHEKQAITETLLDLFQVAPLAHKNYLHLSGGEKQLVQLSRIFGQARAALSLGHTPTLLLDEPFNTLDNARKKTLVQAIESLPATVILTLHGHNPFKTAAKWSIAASSLLLEQ